MVQSHLFDQGLISCTPPKEEVITIRCFSDTTTGLPAARTILKDNFYFAS